MAEANKPASVAQTGGSDTPGAFIKRELNGATFLTLEHVAHMVLVVVVAALVAMGITTVLGMWMGSSASALSSEAIPISAMFAHAEVAWAVGIVASLLVVVPLMIVLDRRTRAEWSKRPDYAGRTAYKVPVYIALGVLGALKITACIGMVSAVVLSLVLLGTGTPIAPLYTDQFVPALIAAVTFGAAAWYVFKLAKGVDLSRVFNVLTVFLSAALVAALLVTAASQAHKPSTQFPGSDLRGMPEPYTDLQNFDDIFKY